MFAFALPTTSPASLAASFISSSTPSLPGATTTRRAVFRDALKRYKRLSPGEQAAAVPAVLSAAEEYLPYLHTLDAYITSQDVTTTGSEFETEWRAVLSRRTGPAEAPRVKRRGLDYEVCFATATLAYAHVLRARTLLAIALQSPHSDSSSSTSTTASSSNTKDTNTSTAESTINQATQHITTAASIFTYLHTRTTTSPRPTPSPPADTTPAVYTALASLCLASATLLAVLKQDPYPSLVALTHDKNSTEWMYKAPTVPSGVKALLLARLCIYASEMASKAAAGVTAGAGAGAAQSTPREELRVYCDDLARTAKAKACRFLAVDAEAQGKGRLGEAIGWVVAGKEILGLTVESEGKGKVGRGLEKLKKAREKRKIEKGAAAAAEGVLAADAGRMEEAMVLGELEKKWRRVNDSVNFETIMPSSVLLPRLPTGRPMFPERTAWTPPKLSSAELAQLQDQTASGSIADTDWLRADDSADDDDNVSTAAGSVSGGFPRGASTGYY
ncbi:hypothetical protein TWF696_008202 [Orbilia brochopaga]|uniref:pH-response regulator protein palC n=1 Tax=Orbilia brochopaga TaxID=3140254 RepID=A0AAV9UHB3_9PEZI